MRRLLAVASSTLLVLLSACGGGGGGDDAPATVARPTSAEAERQRAEDGAALLQSTVRVTFPGEVSIAAEGDALLNAVRIQTPGGTVAMPAERIAARSVRVDDDDPAVLLIESERLVPDNSELRIQRYALAAGAEGSVATRIRSDLTGAQVLLASGPVTPTRPELFGVANVAPVSEADRDAEAVRRALLDHLEARGSSQATIDRALAVFDEAPTDVVQSPKLAAALALLTGTFAEPAIPHLLTDGNCTGQVADRIAFEDPPDFPNLLARVTYTESGARVISVNPIVEGEPIQLLAPILLHEAIHCDRVAEVDEEIAATAFDTYFYLLLVALEPWLPQEGTILSQNFNIDALALINSGRMVPESIGVLPSPGGQSVFANTELEHRSFAEYVQSSYPELEPGPSPDEELAQQYVAILAADLDLPVRSAFNLVYLDGLLGWTFEAPVLFAVMDALGLEPVQ